MPPQVRGPGPARQGERLSPRFQALQDAVAAGRAALASTATDADPEFVVVFDLAGSVEQFMRAVAKVPGLEFLVELEEDEADPDDDFHRVDQDGRIDDPVPESLYMVMTNARAVSELIRLFRLWEADQTVKFERGLNPLRTAFALLRDVGRWGPEDRVRETGLLQQWQETVQVIGGAQSSLPVEIELWFRADAQRRASAQAHVTRLITDAGGTVVRSAVIEGVGYHGLLAELPHRQVEVVLADGPEAIELLTADNVMFVSPAQPMTIPGLQLAEQSVQRPAGGPGAGAPRVALLDGVPLANHVTLAGRLVLDDPDDVASRYTSSQQQHGTAMASLIAHGDLTRPGPPLSRRLYVRPIFEPHPQNGDAETVIAGELLVDLVHRAFRRMFDGDGGQPPAARSVRIVNLSIGDPARVFVRRLSPLGRLLDWLAHRYNLLILVSAGNHPINATVPAAAVADERALRDALLTDARERALHRRLLAPAEAVNVVTVGATHDDAWAGDLPDTVLGGLDVGMPALYSASGAGYRRAVKPEILLPGGRSLFQRPPPATSSSVPLAPASTTARGPGMLVAAPGPSGEPTATAYLHGTSNATALASRTANEIFDVLEELAPSAGDFSFPDPQYHPVLAKTLLVHAALWGELQSTLCDALRLPPGDARRDVTQMIGYGTVDADRVAAASRTRVVLLGAGSITADQQHRFSFPLPPALAAATDWRRLTLTLGWLSPVNPRTQKHRMSRLSFQPPHEELGVKRVGAPHYSVKRGTVQHEVLEGRTAVAYATGDALTVDVECRVDSGRLPGPVRYGLAVSLEVAATVQLLPDLHEQVREQLRLRQRQRPRTRISAQTRR